jgi:hypothetical protein
MRFVVYLCLSLCMRYCCVHDTSQVFAYSCLGSTMFRVRGSCVLVLPFLVALLCGVGGQPFAFDGLGQCFRYLRCNVFACQFTFISNYLWFILVGCVGASCQLNAYLPAVSSSFCGYPVCCLRAPPSVCACCVCGASQVCA